ncbi:hypothetical protein CRT60_03540 [Azospirillum palustre]|uniref:HNH domain-containing protein n=1 Tax=Azospirillum palustre TaxID=2044885 RepID=A0A2B8BCI9_9PROT|nr:HNH endonuclease [Azospirillum palustre]PGH59064.1 hypothetical protein CRT60_03540 [Azospirillum palustre]
MATRICKKCSGTRFNNHNACMDCRNARAKVRAARIKANGGSHTRKEWEALKASITACPDCGRAWSDIPFPTVARYNSVITKGHIVPVYHGGTNDIANIKPQCYECNFRQNAGPLKR